MFCAHLLKTTLKELSKRLRGHAWDTPSVITQNGKLITSKPANEIVARDLVVYVFKTPFKPGLLPNIYFASAQRDGRCPSGSRTVIGRRRRSRRGAVLWGAC
jgi:hypothetical protein